MTRRGEDGFALVAVLVAITVVAALAAAALTLTQGGAAATGGYVAEIEGGQAATAGIRRAAIRLADGEDADDAAEALAWSGWRVETRIEDEAAKLDLNRVPRPALLAELESLGVARERAAAALGPLGRRVVAVDDLAARLEVPAERLAVLRARFTVYGVEAPQPPAPRSSLETYRLIAIARRGGRAVGRWSIVRVTPGFGAPFEWLEHGRDAPVTKAS